MHFSSSKNYDNPHIIRYIYTNESQQALGLFGTLFPVL